MATIVTRSGKGSPLTNTEVDANFTNLNSDKIETNAEVRAAVEAATDSNVFTDADHTKVNSVEASADVTDTANVVAALTAGSNITIGNDGTIAGSAAFTLPTAAANTLGGVKIGSGLSIDGSGVVSASGATNLASTTASTNIVITSSTGNNATVAAATTSAAGVMIAADKSKLDGIETSANVTDTANVVAALTAGTNVAIASDGTISATDTNTVYSVGAGGLTQQNFTTTLKSKLDAVEASATADQTAAQLLTAIKTVDGTGTGLDADLLDGNHASAFLTAEADTFASVTGRGAATTSTVVINSNNTAQQGLSVGEAFTNYGGWHGQSNLHGTSHARNTVKTSTVQMGTYAHDSWHNIGGSTVNGHVGTYTNHGLGFLTQATLKACITAAGNFGINVSSPAQKLDVGGNIQVSGTVDGRDVAADGTKLDTFAAATSFLRSDADDTYAGNLAVNGVTFKNNSNTPRNLKLQPSATSTDTGLSMYLGNGTHALQLYGTSSEYGFLDGNWASWDIRKVKDGNLYLNADTSYYLRPEGTSNFNALTLAGQATLQNLIVGGVIGNNAYNSVASSTIYLGGGNDRANYSLGTLMENTGGNYTKLDIRWHTGIRMFAMPNYGGFRYFSNNAMSTQLFSIGQSDAHVRANNNIYAYTSDIRLKENFRPIENAVDKVKAIGGFIFDWRTDMMEKHEFEPDQQADDCGLIAQDVQKVMPAAIRRAPFDYDGTKPNQSKSGEEFLTVQYEKMVPLLVEAIKELKAEIEELKK